MCVPSAYNASAGRRELVLRLRELLIHAARALAEELRDGEGWAAIWFPSRGE